MKPEQLSFLAAQAQFPDGLLYRPDFIAPEEERDLAERLALLPFKPFEFQGFLGKRRTVSFGWSYRFDGSGLAPAEPIPDWLQPLRERAATLAGREPDAFEHALLIEYDVGAGLGWHRDRPVFGDVIGVSLLAAAPLLAILLSLGATLIYLWYRFEWRFGAAAVVATAHDIVITLGFLAVLQSEISLGTVAALLTIVGYSLNDTIVVFDRIRENLSLPHRGQGFAQIVDRSINETLPRTVLTGVSTLGTLFSLLIFGGPVIRDFSLVLILGIVIGTFSSVFVASPVLYLIEQRWPRKPAKSTTRSPARRQSAAV